jgi:dolichyl-diphosphooligosaccharide--protein glycosyltransferase
VAQTKFPKILSKERIVNGLKILGKLRIKISHSSLMTFSVLLLILFVAFTIRIFPLRWEIDPTISKSQLHLSEFDPYYQYRLTKYMIENGLISPYWPTQRIDTQRWYPYGANMAMSYPALPMTAAVFYQIIFALGINIDLMSFCSIFPAIMGTLACLIIYFLGKDIGGKPVGLLAALFLALSPSYIQRTSLGFFDDETIGIVALLLFAFLFLRAIEEERPINSTIKYSLGSAVALGYFISGWGAAFYPIGLTVLFVFMLILLKKYTLRLLLSYSLTFGLGLFIAINVPYISTRYLTTSVILPVAGVFILLFFVEVFRNLTSAKWKTISLVAFLVVLIGGFVALWQLGYIGGIAGKFISVLNPFTREASPLIESVAEHRISAWGSIYYDLGIGIIFFAVGLFFVLGNLSDKNLFILIFSLTSLYFACSMVRLLVILAPAFSILTAIGIVGLLKPFVTLLKEPPKISVKKKYGLEHVGREFSGAAVFLIFIIVMTNVAFPMPKVYRQAYSPITITAGSLPIAPNEPVQEWLDMLKWTSDRLKSTTVVCSWWDYGYWLTILGNVTTLADNGTINSTQIQNIGFIFMSNETEALKMLKKYNAEYILVFTTFDTKGNWIGWGDEGKWMWMAEISGQKYNWTKYTFGNYTKSGGWEWNERGESSTIYKLMSYGKDRWLEEQTGTYAPTELKYFKEAYFAGLDLSSTEASNKYGGVVPLVCLYKIDYPSE